jgi:hypothetical protein
MSTSTSLSLQSRSVGEGGGSLMADEQRPDRRPRPNTVADAPATPDACRRDFEQGAADRATSAKKDAHANRGGTR